MRLRQLFLILSLLLSLTVLAIAVGMVHGSWTSLRKAGVGQEAMQEFQAVLLAAEMASRERGPANGVLGDNLPADPAKRQRLAAARAKTDAAFGALREMSDADPQHHSPVAPSLQQAFVDLSQARQTIDRIADKERAARSADEIRHAVAQMIQVIKDLYPVMVSLSNEAMYNIPDATDTLIAARLAAEMREYAGQLGSQLTAALTTRKPLTIQELMAIGQLRGRLDQLRQQLLGRTMSIDKRSPIIAAQAAMNTRYFDAAIPFIESQIAIGLQDGHYTVDTATFAARYVPDMDAIVTLRDTLLSEAQGQAERGRTRALFSAIWQVTFGILMFLLLGMTLRLLHRRVISPLDRATELMVAIADERPGLDIPQPRHRDEVAKVFQALTVLNQNTMVRRALEQEREGLLQQLGERNRYLALNNRVLHALSEGAALDQVLDELMRAIEEQHPGALCTVLLADADQATLRHAAAPSMPASWREVTREVPIGEGIGSCGTAAFRRERVIVEDVQLHPFWVNFRDAAGVAGLRACWSQPFMDSHGKLLGTFAVYHREVTRPGEAEIAQIEAYSKLVAMTVERAQLAEALKNTQEQYQLIADNVTDVISVIDISSRQFRYISPSIERIVGFNNEELIGRPISRLMLPEEAAAIAQLTAAALARMAAGDASANILTFEHQAVHKDGHLIPVEVLVKIVPCAEGRSAQGFCVSRDISERKAAEAALVFQRELLAQILDNSPVGTAFITSDVIRYTNPEFEKMFDLRVGDRAQDIYLDPAERAEVLRILQRDGLVRGVEMKFKGAGGTPRDCLVTFLPLVRNGEQGLMGWLLDITERRAAEEAIKKMAYYDQLTGLPNRRLLEDRLSQLLALVQREKRKMAVLFIDLDRFKQVNDVHGHEAGDWLLQEVARRLTACLRESDTATRVGGDEFVVLLPYAARVEDAVMVAEKIRLELARPFAMSVGLVLNISSSIGVVMYPDQADTPGDLLRFGDAAMYQAKKRGRNAVEVFFSEATGQLTQAGAGLMHLEWKPGYACGNTTIDRQHQELFILANGLLELIVNKAPDQALFSRRFNELLAHVKMHCVHEESILANQHYADLPEHRAQHQQLLRLGQTLAARDAAAPIPLNEFMDFLVNKLIIGHLAKEDTKFFHLF